MATRLSLLPLHIFLFLIISLQSSLFIWEACRISDTIQPEDVRLCCVKLRWLTTAVGFLVDSFKPVKSVKLANLLMQRKDNVKRVKLQMMTEAHISWCARGVYVPPWNRTLRIYSHSFLFGPTSTLLEALPSRKHVLLDFAWLSALTDSRTRPPSCQCCSAGERLYVPLFS